MQYSKRLTGAALTLEHLDDERERRDGSYEGTKCILSEPVWGPNERWGTMHFWVVEADKVGNVSKMAPACSSH